MSMKSVLLAGIAVFAACSASGAVAQEAQDVVIMRRVLIDPNKVNPSGWQVGPWSDVSEQCGLVRRTREVRCAAGSCSGPEPASSDEVEGGAQNCEFRWEAMNYGGWSSQCSPTSARSRDIVCVNRAGQPVDASSCEIAYKPEPVELRPIFENCQFSWEPGPWSGWDRTCSDEAVRTRAVSCMNRDLLRQAPERECISADRPPAVEIGTNSQGCVYRWTSGGWSEWDNACSENATRTRQVTCTGSDGNAVPDANCVLDRPPSSEVGVSEAGCNFTYAWDAGEFGAWDSTCSPSALRVRPVVCRRSDGKASSDANCGATPKPAGRETAEVYEGCSVRWDESPFGAWSSTCSSEAIRSRTVRCVRTDNDDFSEVLDDDRCDPALRPDETETAANYESCSYEWRTGSYVFPPACGETVTGVRPVECVRTGFPNQPPVADALCTDPRPSATQSGTNMHGCTYVWQDLGWGDWSSTCSAEATRTKNIRCVDRDGNEAIGKCDPATAPSQTETAAVYEGCRYNWATTYGEWSTPEACAPSRSRTATSVCRRSDGAEVSDVFCTTPKPADVDVENLPACSHRWTGGPWSQAAPTCGTGTQTRSVTCERQDPVSKATSVVADSFCDAASRLDATQSYTNYEACTYAWRPYGQAVWDSTCTTSGSFTQDLRCERSDGTVATDPSRCGTKPSTAGTGVNTSGCATFFRQTDFNYNPSTTSSAWTMANGISIASPGRDGTGGALNFAYSSTTLQRSTALLKAGDRFRIEFWARGNASGSQPPAFNFQLRRANSTDAIAYNSPTIYITGTWTKYSITLARGWVTSGTMQADLAITGYGANVQLDDLVFYATAVP